MIPVTIRQANKDDAEMLADISRYCFYHTYVGMNTKANMDKFMQEQFAHDMLKSEVNDPCTYFLLAYYLENVAGYAKLLTGVHHPALKTAVQIEIARFYALPAYKGKGVGTQLMRACINYAQGVGADALWLGVWEKNKVAISFYTKMGFQKFGEQTFRLGDDMQNDWLMVKRLDEDNNINVDE